MKIARRRGNTIFPDTGIVVIGPSGQPLTKKFPTLGTALSVAQGRALDYGEPVAYTVREWEDDLYRVERDEDGVVTTRRAA